MPRIVLALCMLAPVACHRGASPSAESPAAAEPATAEPATAEPATAEPAEAPAGATAPAYSEAIEFEVAETGPTPGSSVVAPPRRPAMPSMISDVLGGPYPR